MLLLQGLQLLQLGFQALLFLHQTAVLAGVADTLLLQVGLKHIVSRFGCLDPHNPLRCLQLSLQDLPALLQHSRRTLDLLPRFIDGQMQRFYEIQSRSIFANTEQPFRQVFCQQVPCNVLQAISQFGRCFKLAF